MWVYAAVPEKMLMVYAIIFGAHLMPYSWLYRSRAYMAMSVAVPVASLAVGLTLPPHALAAMMLGVEALFAALLAVENKKDNQNTPQ